MKIVSFFKFAICTSFLKLPHELGRHLVDNSRKVAGFPLPQFEFNLNGTENVFQLVHGDI